MSGWTVRTLLPRLLPSRARGAAPGNLAAVLVVALAGAGLVHLLAYHVPSGVPLGPQWVATVLSLLAHCPLVGPLGVILSVASALTLLGLRELRRLERLNGSLAQVLPARPAHRSFAPLPFPPDTETLPRSPWRLVLFVVVLLGVQVGALGIFDALWPMHMTVTIPMVMDSKLITMAMPAAPLLPLGVLHAAVALLLGVLLWRMERRLTRLRALVAGHLWLLRLRYRRVVPPLPLLTDAQLLRDHHGPALFARPPPSSVAA